jgi:hypothetical protein
MKIACKFCGKPTGTQLCNACWEINRHDPIEVYRIQYANSPLKQAFEGPVGICCGLMLTDEYNTTVAHTVILAHLLGIKMQAARIGTLKWESFDGVPGDFKNYQFRKAQ